MPTARVIDLSHHNVIPESLVATRQSGVWGVIHKATEGTGFKDNKLAARASLARDAGMLFGCYHFIREGKIKQQAEHFCSTILELADIRTLVALDYEDADVSLADCRDWIERVEDIMRTTCVLYSGHVLKDAIKAGQDPLWLVERRLWLAQYGKKAELPPGWPYYWLWQYTDAGQVPGVNPPTDLNDYAGTLEQLEEEWSGRYPPIDIDPKPPPPYPDNIISMQIATHGKPMQIIVDGHIVYASPEKPE